MRPAAVLLALASIFLSVFTGCTVGPNYHRPDVPLAPAWKEQPPWRAATPQDKLPKGTWWSIFGDDELSQYEVQALKANQTIESARNQLEQARASARITQSGLFPQMSVAVLAQRSRSSANAPSASGAVLPAVTQNTFSVPFNLSWEADVFGGIRRSVESSNALYQSSAAALENVRLVVTSELAVDYFSLRELDSEISVV
ncbi:MAG TPA: TolC family protein, partial [Candidatus Angelobacter sp.]|nr:TolC family protein [Candidatus Angelobacter sp.]